MFTRTYLNVTIYVHCLSCYDRDGECLLRGTSRIFVCNLDEHQRSKVQQHAAFRHKFQQQSVIFRFRVWTAVYGYRIQFYFGYAKFRVWTAVYGYRIQFYFRHAKMVFLFRKRLTGYGAQPVLRVKAKNGGSYDSTPLYAVFMVLILKFRDMFVSLCLCLMQAYLTD